MQDEANAWESASSITIDHLAYAYPAYRDLPGEEVLRDVSMSVRRGEFLTILGPSGCGKTTLLRLIAGVFAPTMGSIDVGPSVGPRHKIGYAFQSPNLLPWLTVVENIALPIRLIHDRMSNEARSLAHDSLSMLGLTQYASAYPWQLSLGMQMRVNLGRALISQPEILLLDEPFAALDAPTWRRLQRDVLQIWMKQQLTCIHVTHNVAEAVAMADRILLLSNRPGSVRKEYRVSLVREGPEPRLFGAEATELSKVILREMDRDPGLRGR